MKNKKITYLLIIAVVALWGLIFVRILQAGADPAIVLPERKYERAPVTGQILDMTSWGLQASGRDPFAFGSVMDTTSVKSMVRENGQILRKVAVKAAVNWSEFTYLGFLKSAASGKLLAVIRIKNRDHNLAQGQQAEGLKIIKILGDSVKVNYCGEFRTIKINQ